MNETVEQLTKEIHSFLDDMDEIASSLSKKSSVSHKSNALIQWYGGILGAIREIREDNRLYKMINEPICSGYSFYSISLLMIVSVQNAVDKQLEVQKLLSVDDELYYNNVIAIYSSYKNLYNSWYNYSPDMATALLSGDEEEEILSSTVQSLTKENFKKLDLPTELSFLKDNEETSGPGCFGVFIAIIFTTVTLLGVAGYGLYQLLA